MSLFQLFLDRPPFPFYSWYHESRFGFDFFFFFLFFFHVAISDSVQWLPYLGFVPGPTRTTSKGLMSLLFLEDSKLRLARLHCYHPSAWDVLPSSISFSSFLSQLVPGLLSSIAPHWESCQTNWFWILFANIYWQRSGSLYLLTMSCRRRAELFWIVRSKLSRLPNVLEHMEGGSCLPSSGHHVFVRTPFLIYDAA